MQTLLTIIWVVGRACWGGTGEGTHQGELQQFTPPGWAVLQVLGECTEPDKWADRQTSHPGRVQDAQMMGGSADSGAGQ